MPETIKQLEETKVAVSCAEVLEVTIKVQATKSQPYASNISGGQSCP